MKPFKSLLYLIATLGVLAFASCGQRHPKYVIGVSQCSEDVWRDKLNNELRIAAFSANDVDLRISSATTTWHCKPNRSTSLRKWASTC